MASAATSGTLPYGVDGKTRLDMSKAYGAGAGDAWKFYYSEAVPEGWLGYQYPSDGTRLMFTFPKDKVALRRAFG